MKKEKYSVEIQDALNWINDNYRPEFVRKVKHKLSLLKKPNVKSVWSIFYKIVDENMQRVIKQENDTLKMRCNSH
jgi:hypothetical protein